MDNEKCSNNLLCSARQFELLLFAEDNAWNLHKMLNSFLFLQAVLLLLIKGRSFLINLLSYSTELALKKDSCSMGNIIAGRNQIFR